MQIPPTSPMLAKLMRDFLLCSDMSEKVELRLALSRIWRTMGQFSRAHDILQDGLAEVPQNPQLMRSLGLELFRKGEIEKGLSVYDKGRWQLESHQKYARPFKAPYWDGSSVRGKKILVWTEQGLGDQIMQLRILPHLIDAGAKITLEADPRVFDLISKDYREKLRCIPQLKIPPAPLLEEKFDFQTSSFSAWRFIEGIKSFRPYLSADEKLVQAYRKAWSQSGKKKHVGLSWFSANKATGAQRSVDLSLLSPMAAGRSDIQFHSLQYGVKDIKQEQVRLGASLGVDPQIDHFAAQARFAGQIKALDLVVTIDNSVAHLAGALEVPTWLILPKGSEWRWGVSGTESFLYPTLKLFRSEDIGHWGSVQADLYTAFAQFRP